MRYRDFPNTTLTVSEVGFGLWTTGTDWWGQMRDADAVQLIQGAFALGITRRRRHVRQRAERRTTLGGAPRSPR
jgi:hypothetical protein